MNDFLVFFFRVSAKYLGYGLIAFVVFKALTKREYIFSLIAGFLSYYGIVEIIRMFSFKSRPFDDIVCSVLIEHKATSSFPSGHSAFFFALSYVVWHQNKKAGWVLFSLSSVISLSRVVSGVHWPSDILVGALIGVLIGWLMTQTSIYRKFVPRERLELS